MIQRPDGAWENSHSGPMHEWFSLSYASYLVLPRSWLQEMPIAWQEKMRGLLEELHETLDVDDPPGGYRVLLLTERKKFAGHKWADYRHGPIPPRRVTP